MLSQFLQKAEHDPAYRPDSTLSERGPQSSSAGSTPNLTLHNLNKILQGIEGKRVGGVESTNTLFGDLAGANTKNKRQKLNESPATKQRQDKSFGQDFTETETEVEPQNFPSSPPLPTSASKAKNKKRKTESTTQLEVETDGSVGEIAQEQDRWQDKDNYDMAQVVETEGDLDVTMQDDAHPGGVEQPTTKAEAREEMAVHVERQKTEADKKARKAAKKARQKEARAKKEQEKKKK